MQLRRNARVEMMVAAGIVVIALLVLGVLVIARRDSGSGSPSTATRPVAPSTDPRDIPLVTDPPATVSPEVTLPPLAANVPNIGPSKFPSSTCGTVSASAKFVAPNGNDSNPGTQSAPYRTINHAQQQIRHGQTLFIRGGDYYNLSPHWRA